MKKILSFIFILALIIGLAACSNNEDKKKKTTTKKGEIKVAEMMQENKTHVWYVVSDPLTDELEKDSNINRFIVTKNGKMKVYVTKPVPNTTVGEMIKQNNKKLIKDIKEQDKYNYDITKSSLIADTKTELDEGKKYMKQGKDKYRPSNGSNGTVMLEEEQHGTSPEKTMKKLEDYKSNLESSKYQKPKSHAVDLEVVDGSKEQISTARNYNFPKSIGHADETDNDLSTLKFNSAFHPIKIKGEKLAGLSYRSGDESEDSNNQAPYLVTKVGKSVKEASLDEADDPAIKDNKSK